MSNPSLIQNNNRLQLQPTRRKLLTLTIILSPIAPFLPCTSTWAQTQQLLHLETYTDTTEGLHSSDPHLGLRSVPFPTIRFRLFIFGSINRMKWNVGRLIGWKSRGDCVFEDPSKGGNNIGVVVTPVRLTSLRDFGDPQFVANKLIQAEKRKVNNTFFLSFPLFPILIFKNTNPLC